MSGKFAVVDLFAGPGGLAEGFSSVRSVGNGRAFSIVLSVEKEFSAHQTLLLRSFLHQFCDGFPEEYYCFLNGETAEPDWSALYPDQWRAATREALNLELGPPAVASELNVRLDTIRENYQGNVVLIGGPPCQAYSVVGRVRNRGIAGYTAREDHRHFLYKEYISILDRLRPAVFVLENVKGILSASVDGEKVFDRVLEDLCAIGSAGDGYQLMPLSPRSRGTSCLFGSHPLPTDFIVRAEDFGLPQARHRVIVVGVRRDIAVRLGAGKLEEGILQVSGT